MHDKPLVLKLLGTPQVLWQGAPMILPRRQARAVLYRLATEMRAVTRDSLLLLLWPDTPEPTARRNLSRLLSYLRTTLPHPDILQTDRSGVSLNPDLTSSDTAEFFRYVGTEDEATLDAAASLVRGPFLAGFALPGNHDFDNWLSTRQQQIERSYLATLSKLVNVKTTSADYPAAVGYARQYLEIDELAEEIHRQLITLYAITGQRSAALGQFEQCMMVLERELGVEPLPETRAAYEAARDGSRPQLSPTAPEVTWTTLPGLNLPLVGRESAWGEIAQAYGHFQNGGAILITGAAGVGKSRLMQEFATAQEDSLVLTGNSNAAGQTLPYQPLVQALRQALSLKDRWDNTAPIWLAEVSRLLPEIPVHFPGLPQPVDVERQQAQARLFEGLTHLFRGLATDRPIILCLDDIQWADDATIGWLQYAGSRLAGSRICILATCRIEELAALDRWRPAIARTKLVTEVHLGGLSPADVKVLLQQAGSEIDQAKALAKRLHAATGGNAFFVLETIRELLETGQLVDPPADLPLPPAVRETILWRAARLTPLARQICDVSAVLTPTLTLATIADTAGRNELETAASLEELIVHQLLTSDGDRFRFQHDLTQEAIYHNISAWRRRLLHRRAANVLAELPAHANGEPASIAAHFEAAGYPVEAIDYYRQAAAAAEAVYAHQEAVDYLRRAIDLANESAEAMAVLPQLYEALADSLTSSGSFPTAEEAYRRALDLATEEDALRLANLKRKLAAVMPGQQRADKAIILYHEALAHLDDLPPGTATVQWQSIRLNILLGLLDARYFQLRPEAMAELREQTQALLDEVGTAEQQADFRARLNQLAFLRNGCRSPAENILVAKKALDYAYESGNPSLIARQKFHLGFHQLWHGDLDNAADMLRLALAAAESLGDSWLQNQCLAYLSVLYRLQGNTGQVAAYLTMLKKISEQVGHSYYIGVGQANAGWLHYRTGEWQQALAQAEAALASWAVTEYPLQWLAHWLLLALSMQQDRLADAVVAAQAMIDPGQQRLPDEVGELLGAAISAWDTDEKASVRSHFVTAVEVATQHGYI